VKKQTSDMTDVMLAAYLAGELSEEGHEAVQRWLQESDPNKQYFDELELIWNQSRNVSVNSSISENEAWTRFLQRTKVQIPKSPPLRRRSVSWRRIAAVLVLFLGSGSLVWFVANCRDKVQVIAGTTGIKSAAMRSGQHPPARNGINVPYKAPAYKPETTTDIVPNHATAGSKTGKRKLKGHSASTISRLAFQSITRQTKENSAAIFEDNCIENYKYHGPKYDSNF
jgi:hypothetical protein